MLGNTFHSLEGVSMPAGAESIIRGENTRELELLPSQLLLYLFPSPPTTEQ